METIDRGDGGQYTIHEKLADNRKLITRRRYVSQRAIFKKDYFKEGYGRINGQSYCIYRIAF